MALKTYYGTEGQSLQDVAVQVYGGLDRLVQMAVESGRTSLTRAIASREEIKYDPERVQDANTVLALQNLGVTFATFKGDLSQYYYIVQQAVPPKIIVPTPDVPLPPTPENMPYVDAFSTSFTSNADGVTSFFPTTDTGGSMAGNKYDIVQVEIEIKPLKATQFVWNKATGQLSLLGGLTIDMDQTAFIIFKETVTP